jgi:hypothetical protein
MPVNARRRLDLDRDSHGADTAARVVGFSLLVTAAALVVTAPISAARAAAQPNGWYPAAGPTWFLPTDRAVRHAYAGGPGIAGGIGYAWGDRFGAEVRLGWFRHGGTPEARLAESAESRLTVIPFTAEFLYRTRLASAIDGTERLGAFAAGGPALIFSRERFAYRFAGSTIVAEGRRSDLAGTSSLGLEGGAGSSRLGWRLVLRGILAGGRRKVLRPGGRSDERGSSATPSHASLGFELTWR